MGESGWNNNLPTRDQENAAPRDIEKSRTDPLAHTQQPEPFRCVTDVEKSLERGRISPRKRHENAMR
jgi:hypothetical protein